MKFLSHPLVSAIALSMFCSLSMIAVLISPDHVWVYHHIGSPTPVFGGVALFFAITWAFFGVVLVIARSFPSFQLAVWTGIICLLPYELVTQAQYMEVLKPAFLATHIAKRLLLLACVAAWATWVWRWRRIPQPAFDRMHGLATSILGFAAIGSVVTLIQFGWCYDQALAIEQTPVLHQRARGVAYHGSREQRVIWIVLDELSYDQVYADRYPGLKLPEFGRLATQSVLFDQVQPASNQTRVALPAMLTGHALEDIHSPASGMNVDLLLAPRGQPLALNPEDSIFGDAIALGDSTGVSGWFNPYCRLLGPVLDRCFRALSDQFQQGMLPRGSVLENALAPWKTLLTKSAWPTSNADDQTIAQVRADRISDYKALVAAGDSLLADPSINLKFLHMPFPHPPGYYDRKSGNLTTGPATYIDNLALADRYLRHVRELLTAQGEWDSDAVLITGDHSWRTTLLWMGGVDWTPEEQRASRGGFDTRPAWILKLPNQQAPAHIDSPLSAVTARSLVRNLLTGNVKTASDVLAFAEGSLTPQNDRVAVRTSPDLHAPAQAALTQKTNTPGE